MEKGFPEKKNATLTRINCLQDEQTKNILLHGKAILEDKQKNPRFTRNKPRFTSKAWGTQRNTMVLIHREAEETAEKQHPGNESVPNPAFNTDND